MMSKRRKILYPVIFFLGSGLMIWQIYIFRNTIISNKIPIGIILFFGIMALILDHKNYGKTYNYSGTWLYFYSAIQYLISYGFIASSIFTLINFYFAEEYNVKKSFEIIKRTSLPARKNLKGERQPTFLINYDGEMKELVFSTKYYREMNSFKTVEMEIRKGYFGFDILENKKLKR